MAMMDEPSQARLESDRSPDGDAVQFLLFEHDKIMGLLEQLRGCGGGAEGSRRELWHQIIREAATHEEAEDQVVYPTVRPALADMLAAHARNEEEQVFSLLKTLDAGKLAQMGDALRGAKAIAPTRPHPAAPNTPRGNVAAGLPAGMVDRARDAVRSVTDKLDKDD